MSRFIFTGGYTGNDALFPGMYESFDEKMFYRLQEFFPGIDMKRNIRRLSGNAKTGCILAGTLLQTETSDSG